MTPKKWSLDSQSGHNPQIENHRSKFISVLIEMCVALVVKYSVSLMGSQKAHISDDKFKCILRIKPLCTTVVIHRPNLQKWDYDREFAV